jgi:acetyl esterase
MLGTVPLAQMRGMEPAMRDRLDVPVGQLAVNREVTADTEAGQVPVRLFDSRQTRPAGPMMVFFHGGGFWGGSSEYHAPFCAEAARVLDMAVVGVDYRLAPEDPFPAAVEDCEAAARWIASDPQVLERTATELIMCGDSTGGTMAIVTTMALRDKPAARPVRLYVPSICCTARPI